MRADPGNAQGERLEKGGAIAGRYVVESLLGESPAARVYAARENSTDRTLCIKLYHPQVSARLLAAPDFFLRAARMTGISHDNLCPCFDIGMEADRVYVARAHAEGIAFEDWARSNRGKDDYFSRGLEITWQSCQGLNALHQRTRHLAVHPGNVIVGPLSVHLCDWDPRCPDNPEMTPEALPVRPEFLGYRAPEAGRPGGFLSHPSTDLFAAAGLLFRLLMGRHPYPDAARTLKAVGTFDNETAGFLAKALHPDPEARFREAEAFAEALWELRGSIDRWQETPRFASEVGLEDRPQAFAAPSLPFQGGTVMGPPDLVPAPIRWRSPARVPSIGSPNPSPAVSLSSLERDPVDTLSGNEAQGYTRFGFKGGGGDRTGELARDPEEAARGKPRLVWVAMGTLILALTAGALFFILRMPVTGPSLPSAASAQQALPAHAQGKKESRPDEAKPPKAATAETEGHPVAAAVTAAQWLQRADDYNDSGKLAEANAAYTQALGAGDASPRQKIRALGGLAVTFQGLGKPEKAREAVEGILALDRRNAFALKMRERLK